MEACIYFSSAAEKSEIAPSSAGCSLFSCMSCQISSLRHRSTALSESAVGDGFVTLSFKQWRKMLDLRWDLLAFWPVHLRSTWHGQHWSLKAALSQLS